MIQQYLVRLSLPALYIESEIGSMKNFSIHGTETGSQISRRLDEIVVRGIPETIRDLGLFLITAAYEISKNEPDHIHLQDSIRRFSYRRHADVIVMRAPAPKKYLTNRKPGCQSGDSAS